MADTLDDQVTPATPRPGTHGPDEIHTRLRRVLSHDAACSFDDWTIHLALHSFPQIGPKGSAPQDSLTPGDIERAVHLLAQQSASESIEAFAQELSTALLARFDRCASVELRIESHLWKPLVLGGTQSSSALMKGSKERQTTHVSHPRNGAMSLCSGFTSMTLLKTDGPGARQAAETTFCVEWTYIGQNLPGVLPFNQIRRHMRERLITHFEQHAAQAAEPMLRLVAESAMKETSSIGEVFLQAVIKASQAMPMESGSLLPPRSILVPLEAGHCVEVRVRREPALAAL